jgi:hypothetical protein
MFEVVAQGEGPLFMGPDADKARNFFRHKERALVNKVMSVKRRSISSSVMISPN